MKYVNSPVLIFTGTNSRISKPHDINNLMTKATKGMVKTRWLSEVSHNVFEAVSTLKEERNELHVFLAEQAILFYSI